MNRAISICCPTRGRPELARRMAKSAIDMAHEPNNVEVLFYLNEDDPLKGHYDASLPCTTYIMGRDGPTSYSWNQLAKAAYGDIIMLMGDDVVFTTRDWDKILRERAAAAKPCSIFSFDDGRSALGTGHPHPALTRRAYDKLGYLACPMFRHFYLDTWLVRAAQTANCFEYLADVQLSHQKPAETTGGMDETKQRVARTTINEADAETFNWGIATGAMLRDINALLGGNENGN